MAWVFQPAMFMIHREARRSDLLHGQTFDVDHENLACAAARPIRNVSPLASGLKLIQRPVVAAQYECAGGEYS